MIERAVVLAGGTGGAKLAEGMQQLLGEGLSVIANTADDVEILGADVSPDPDLITYWLSGEIDEAAGLGAERGHDDGVGADGSARRARLVPASPTATSPPASTAAHSSRRAGREPARRARSHERSGSAPRVLPMTEQPVRTRVRTARGWRGLQEFLWRTAASPRSRASRSTGIAEAAPTPEVLAAIAAAEAIVIGPSNPVISIGPILAVPGMREALAASGAPIAAVSPYVEGRVVKGPTDSFMAAIGRPSTAAGVASLYAGLIGGMVCDEGDPDPPPDGIEVLRCPTLMDGPAGRRAVAQKTLEFAASLTGQQ